METHLLKQPTTRKLKSIYLRPEVSVVFATPDSIEKGNCSGDLIDAFDLLLGM